MNPYSLILDPWGGSGTTAAVCSRNNISAISVDINPVMAIFASAKSNEVIDAKQKINKILNSDFLYSTTNTDLIDYEADSIYSEESFLVIKSFINNLGEVLQESNPSSLSNSEGFRSAILDPNSVINPEYAFCMSALFITLRNLSNIKKFSNPTWLNLKKNQITFKTEVFKNELLEVTDKMFDSLQLFYKQGSSFTKAISLSADVRTLPIESNSIDAIITSPPYLTRIDYAVSTLPELSLFTNEAFLTYLRHRTIGSPVITKDIKIQKPHWGELCNTILDAIKTHPSKASQSYYWKNITQYFMDIDAALDELYRVMKPKSSGLIVVQSSYFKEIEIPLGEIYVELATSKGFISSIVFRENVRNHIAHVNTKSNTYKKNKIFHEDTVSIYKS